MARIINFFDGAESETVPTIGNIVASDLTSYVDDAAYEAAETGAPAEGNIYFNTTIKLIRYYNGTIWGSLTDEVTAQVVENKTLDGTSATGNNTITNDADKITYDNTTSGRSSTDLQGLGDEYDIQLDENAGDIADLRTTTGTLDGDTDMGAFDGDTISDNVSAKEGMQELETALELISAAVTPQGLWNADTNTPTLVSSVGTEGHFYIVSVAGTTNLDGEDDWNAKDWAIFSGGVWNKIDNTDSVVSVNGKIGIVVLDTDDIAEGSVNHYADGSIETHSDVVVTTPNDGQVLKRSGGNWINADETLSNGELNYVEGNNHNYESTVGDWIAYADAAASTPVDGTDGAPTSTFTRTTTGSEIIRGIASGKLTKDAVNRQGEGFSLNVDIDPKDQGNIIIVRVDYKTTDNYVSGDIIGYVYDITNGGTPQILSNDDNSGEFLAHTGNGVTFLGTFNAASNSTEYRIIFHIATTNASAYNMIVDRIRVGPDRLAPGANMEDLGKLPTDGSWTTNTTYVGQYWREGSHLIGEVTLTLSGAPNATTLQVNLPDGLQIDIDRLSNEGEFFQDLSISGMIRDVAPGEIKPMMCTFSTIDKVFLRFYEEDGAALNLRAINNIDPFTFASGDFLTIRYKVPIIGWKSTQILSTVEANNLVVKGRFKLSSSQTGITNAITLVDFDTPEIDSHNGFDSGNSKYIIQSDGDYFIYASLNPSSLSSNDKLVVSIRLNQSSTLVSQSGGGTQSNMGAQVTYFGHLLKGDEIDITTNSTTDNNYTLLTASEFSIFKISDVHTFSVFGKNEFLSADSSNFLLTTGGFADNEYALMTGNSIDLKPGTYILTGATRQGFSSGTPPVINQILSRWSEENGDNTTSTPNGIGTSGNIVLQAGSSQCLVYEPGSAINEYTGPVQSIRILVKANQTVYLNQRIRFSDTGTNGFINSQIYAERIA